MRKSFFFFLMFLFGLSLYAQETKDVPFNGQILDAANKPVKKAQVWITDSKSAIKTDKNGQFGLLNVKQGDTLKIMVKKTVYTVPVGAKKSILIHLWGEGQEVGSEESQTLTDIGFGLVNKRNSSRSSNHITGQELRDSGQTDLLEALKGRIPGLDVSSNMGGGESARFSGPSSLNASNAPVFVVDGYVVPSLSGYNVNQIDYVEVTRDASMYGARGASGAIIVKTIGY